MPFSFWTLFQSLSGSIPARSQMLSNFLVLTLKKSVTLFFSCPHIIIVFTLNMSSRA